ncbi:hypothetical protein [Aureibaculum luteum]|uniref:hypothetical protein n=1 Tax=Aureibaculum luteum TaxID=1548456 RepID=UPI000E50430E|nr:hypothetical protein [Aureibaculum luteum]
MYLARSSSTMHAQAPFYINILENIISDVNSKEKIEIDSAIIEARQVAKGEKEIFSINNNHHFFVVMLLTSYRDRLNDLTKIGINHDTYREILNLLK